MSAPPLALLAWLLGASPVAAQQSDNEELPPISDNSFLIEEAYNQEAGIVQHISAFSRAAGGDWLYTFTQEWPLAGQKHQVGFTVPLAHADFSPGAATGLGDIGLNYRYQLVGKGAVAVAPRATLNLPTGSAGAGRGAGALGLQVDLPLSVALSKRLVTHYNAGTTLVPSANNGFGSSATTASYNLGGSIVWLARPTFNVLVEGVWLSSETVVGSGITERTEQAFLNPGIRWAFNFPSGLQIVPGVAYTVGIGPSRGDEAVFFYLSFEHPFKSAVVSSQR